MHQIDHVLAIRRRLAGEKTSRMAGRPHQPGQAQNIHRRPRQVVQPVLQLLEHLSAGGLRQTRGILLHRTVDVAIHRGGAGEDDPRNMVSQRGIDDLLHRL